MSRLVNLERLRRLALGDQSAVDEMMCGAWRDPPGLDDGTTALVRLACIVAAEAKGPALSSCIDECHAAGVETYEILETVAAMSPVIGRERTQQATKDTMAAEGIRA